MADFTQTSVTKTAVRELPAPIADAATFAGIIADIIANNPWGCTPYTSGGVEHAAVEKASESYTVKVNYEDEEGAVIGDAAVDCPSLSGFNAAATELQGNEALETAVGGDVVRNPDADTFNCRLKCHAANGELYYVSFTRKSVRVTSYEDDSILTTIETWADGVTALN
ncbi:hypothetical protein [Methanofollis fontis]|uniref:Uncharacterized protein n=1 Tax=Methanofollis fontis TaxID=2052832 RepID=A0A483CSU8_9EURY|nr:hypothetical protein [Methanofollis fontis]TAJ43633.1 hypothetical protein CUJ86_09815 [Methanofollis fontis]